MINIILGFMKSFKRSQVFQYWRVALFFLSLLSYSVCGFMYFELSNNPDLSWSSAFWWSIVTMTTVGYGDFFPGTDAGRYFVGIPTMLFGIGLFGYILSMLASAMVEAKMRGFRGMKKIDNENHIVICRFTGLGRMLKLISEIKEEAATNHSKIIIIDEHLDELPSELQKIGVEFVSGSPSRVSSLEQANVKYANSVIIQANSNQGQISDNDNLKIVLTIKEYSPETHVVVECVDPENEIFFKRAKCDSIVCIASLTDQVLVQEMHDPGVGSVLRELTSNEYGKEFYIVPIPPKTVDYRSVKEYYATSKTVIIGIRRDEQNHLLPDDDFIINSNDKTILIAPERPV